MLLDNLTVKGLLKLPPKRRAKSSDLSLSVALEH